jgi:hypothetical protein
MLVNWVAVRSNLQNPFILEMNWVVVSSTFLVLVRVPYRVETLAFNSGSTCFREFYTSDSCSSPNTRAGTSCIREFTSH